MQKQQSSCPFSRSSYLFQKSDNTGIPSPLRATARQQSFADYVSSLGELNIGSFKTPKNKLDCPMKQPARTKTLPKLETQKELNSMKSHFVVTNNKNKSRPSLQPRQSQQFQSLDRLIEKRSFVISPRLNTGSKKPSFKMDIKPDSTNSLGDDEKVLYYRCGGEEVVNQIVLDFYRKTQNYRLIKDIDDKNIYKNNFQYFLEHIMGKPIFFNMETLKIKHMALDVKNSEFNLFKFYLIKSFIKANKGPYELTFEFAALIEQFRYLIMPQDKTFAQIYNQKAENKTNEMLDTIYQLSKQTYSKIFTDTTLSVYFQDIQLEDQAKKFGVIMQQMMSWDFSGDDITAILRKSHESMHLTSVHFTLFKQFLIDSMRQMGITDKQIETVTSRMDGYRSCIIDQDSLLDFFRQSQTMKNTVIRKYENALKQDARLRTLNQEVLEKHACYLIRYVSTQHLPNLTKRDLILLHSQCPMKLEWLDAFRDNFFLVIKPLNFNNLILQDYSDLWFQMRHSIINHKSIKNHIGGMKVDILQDKLQNNLQDNDNYSYYFRNSDYQIRFHIKRIMSFIFRSINVYKANDLRVIHQSLKITEATFNIFVYLVKFVMETENLDHSLIQEAEAICMYYKNSICNL